MRLLLLAGVALAVASTALSAQQTGSGTLSGRVTDSAKSVLPGVTVTANAGAVRRDAVTGAEGGEYQIGDLPPGTYNVTAELPGFLTKTQVVEVRAAERRTLDFSLPLGCFGGLDPPSTVHFPFDQMLTMIDAVAYVRILEVGRPEQLITDQACFSVRPYVAELLGLINIVTAAADAKRFRFYGERQKTPLADGDELITFLWRDDDSTYHEWHQAHRMPIRNGRLDWTRTDAPQVANGDAVDDVLNTIRAAVRSRPPQP